jgi:hypothetical protein
VLQRSHGDPQREADGGEVEDQKVNPLTIYQLSNALVSSISVGGAVAMESLRKP